MPKADLNNENLEALEKGLPNLLQHVDNVKNVYGLPCVVARGRKGGPVTAIAIVNALLQEDAAQRA